MILLLLKYITRKKTIGEKEPFYCEITDDEVIYYIDAINKNGEETSRAERREYRVRRDEDLRVSLNLSVMYVQIAGKCNVTYREIFADGTLADEPHFKKEGEKVGGTMVFFTYRNAKKLVAWLEAELGIEAIKHGRVNQRHIENEDAGLTDL